MQKIDSGEINYSDAIIKNKKLPFSSIGFSPQITVMDFYTTVKDNVILGLNLAGITGKEAENLCEKALKTVFLYEKKIRLLIHCQVVNYKEFRLHERLLMNPVCISLMSLHLVLMQNPLRLF